MRTRTTMAGVLGALLLALDAGAQAPPAILSLQTGAAAHPFARFAGARWERTADVVPCAAPDAAERVVATGSARVRLPRPLAPGAPEWTEVEAAINRVVERRQREHSVSAARLTSVPIHYERVYVLPARDRQPDIYYFEASRRVPDPGTAPDVDPKGTLRIAVSGWLHRVDGALRPLGSKSELGWEEDVPEEDVPDDRPRPRHGLLPIGVVARASRPLWVMKGAAGDIQWISAYLVDAGGVQTAIDPVRCAR